MHTSFKIGNLWNFKLSLCRILGVIITQEHKITLQKILIFQPNSKPLSGLDLEDDLEVIDQVIVLC